MPKSGRQKLESRVSRFLSNASLLQDGRRDKVLDGPVVSLRQMNILAREYDFLGATHKGAKRGKRTFCDALRRHRTRQARGYNSNACRHVRALRKLIKSYVEMPGVTYVREPVAEDA